ncbi:phage integrase N-terminal SAM-like domain-containing protein [Undibacterium sp. SXout7W]|uniref:phage integrase N-terminal SAM-like domain-containing protein n=1 Tax=Undibacterium sp. SXout7W TaxID=3413049 RepID=UPI003BEFA879
MQDQARERLRYKHYSLSVEKVYMYLIRFFILLFGIRRPRNLTAPEVEAFIGKQTDTIGISLIRQYP